MQNSRADPDHRGSNYLVLDRCDHDSPSLCRDYARPGEPEQFLENSWKFLESSWVGRGCALRGAKCTSSANECVSPPPLNLRRRPPRPYSATALRVRFEGPRVFILFRASSCVAGRHILEGCLNKSQITSKLTSELRDRIALRKPQSPASRHHSCVRVVKYTSVLRERCK